MSDKHIDLFFAIHPSWAQEITKLATDINLVKETLQASVESYMGSAFPHAKLAFTESDVWQINDKEYYSYNDGMRYYLTDDGKRIALVNLSGVLYSGHYSDYEMMSEKIKMAEHPAYHGVMFRANSPGGMCQGMRKLNNAVASYSKPIGAFVSGNLNSAAAFVTAPCSFIMADLNENNSFGSIGVFTVRENISGKLEEEKVKVAVIRNTDAHMKFKPNPYEPWSEDELALIQNEVNAEAKVFHEAMGNQRGLTPENLNVVKSGAEFNSADAAKYGLHDGTGTFEDAIEKLANYNQIFI